MKMMDWGWYQIMHCKLVLTFEPWWLMPFLRLGLTRWLSRENNDQCWQTVKHGHFSAHFFPLYTVLCQLDHKSGAKLGRANARLSQCSSSIAPMLKLEAEAKAIRTRFHTCLKMCVLLASTCDNKWPGRDEGKKFTLPHTKATSRVTWVFPIVLQACHHNSPNQNQCFFKKN